MPPFPPVVGPCIWRNVRIHTSWNKRRGGIDLPAGDLEGGAKDLSTYKLRHLDRVMAEAAVQSRDRGILTVRDVRLVNQILRKQMHLNSVV